MRYVLFLFLLWPGVGEAQQPQRTMPKWVAEINLDDLLADALDEFDHALKSSRYSLPTPVTDTTIVPLHRDTNKMTRFASRRERRKDTDVIDVGGEKYKLNWLSSNFHIEGRVPADELRLDYLRPSFTFWHKQFAEQHGDSIVTCACSQGMTAPHGFVLIKTASTVRKDLHMRACLFASERGAIITFDTLIGVQP